MKTKYLFNHKWKSLGWVIFGLGLILGLVIMIHDYDYPNWEMSVYPLFGEKGIFGAQHAFTWSTNNISDELATVLLIVGGVLVAFSKTKDEDEYISRIRMESLIWATYVNYAVLLLAVLLVFNLSFFNVLVFNMFTVLFFFLVRFHYVLFKNKLSANHEE